MCYVYQNQETGGGDGHTGELEYKHVWVVRHDGLLFASGWHISADEYTKLGHYNAEDFAEHLPADSDSGPPTYTVDRTVFELWLGACKAALDGIKNLFRDVDWAVSLPKISTWPNWDRALEAATTSAGEAVPMPFRLSVCGIEEFVAASCKDFTWKSQGLHYSYPCADGTVAD